MSIIQSDKRRWDSHGRRLPDVDDNWLYNFTKDKDIYEHAFIGENVIRRLELLERDVSILKRFVGRDDQSQIGGWK